MLRHRWPVALAATVVVLSIASTVWMSILNSRAADAEDRGRVDEAERLWRRAHEILTNVVGEDATALTQTLQNLAFLEKHLGRYDRAEALFQEMLSLYEKEAGPESADSAATLIDMAGLAVQRQDLATADRRFRRAIEIFDRAVWPDHPARLDALNAYGEFLLTRRRPTEAAPSSRKRSSADAQPWARIIRRR